MFDSLFLVLVYEIFEVDFFVDDVELCCVYCFCFWQMYLDIGGDVVVFIQVQCVWELIGIFDGCVVYDCCMGVSFDDGVEWSGWCLFFMCIDIWLWVCFYGYFGGWWCECYLIFIWEWVGCGVEVFNFYDFVFV